VSEQKKNFLLWVKCVARFEVRCLSRSLFAPRAETHKLHKNFPLDVVQNATAFNMILNVHTGRKREWWGEAKNRYVDDSEWMALLSEFNALFSSV
jgi:hypothetical protein